VSRRKRSKRGVRRCTKMSFEVITLHVVYRLLIARLVFTSASWSNFLLLTIGGDRHPFLVTS
jgi:hypothetical protein